jgi:hypothetical protein
MSEMLRAGMIPLSEAEREWLASIPEPIALTREGETLLVTSRDGREWPFDPQAVGKAVE